MQKSKLTLTRKATKAESHNQTVKPAHYRESGRSGPQVQIPDPRSQIPELEPGCKSSIQQTDFPQSGQKGDILDKHSLTQQGRGSRFPGTQGGRGGYR